MADDSREIGGVLRHIATTLDRIEDHLDWIAQCHVKPPRPEKEETGFEFREKKTKGERDGLRD